MGIIYNIWNVTIKGDTTAEGSFSRRKTNRCGGKIWLAFRNRRQQQWIGVGGGSNGLLIRTAEEFPKQGLMTEGIPWIFYD